MKRSIKELKGYSLQAIDGDKGKVKNFLFDDETWTIRYLEADLGNLFSEKRVLVPKGYLGVAQWEEKHFPVGLTVEQIKNSPKPGFDLPVSRKYEKELMAHYELEPYWPAHMAAFSGRESMFYPGHPFKIPTNRITEDQIETNLRSFNEIEGYSISSTDERFGHVSDLIIDDTDWQILYVVIDTKNIVPWSKLVMLPIELIDEISFVNREAAISLPQSTIKNAPEYNSAMSVNEEYEKVLYDFYGRKISK